MKLTFIGTGSAFTVGGNYQSNMILESNSMKKLLIDCGSDARHALHELNLSYRDINAVYISHLHSDHCGGLEWLAFCTKFDENCRKPILYIQPDLIDSLWKILSVGLCSLKDKHIDLSTYFEVHVIEDRKFTWEGITINTFPTVHIELATGLMPCYGLQFQTDGKTVLLTSDTQYVADVLQPLYKQSDIIFHDCEISPKKSGVHGHYSELKNLSPEVKNKMWLYHYQPLQLPDARTDGFRGFVRKGQCFDFQKPETLTHVETEKN